MNRTGFDAPSYQIRITPAVSPKFSRGVTFLQSQEDRDLKKEIFSNVEDAAANPESRFYFVLDLSPESPGKINPDSKCAVLCICGVLG